jgi:hypothetical protein
MSLVAWYFAVGVAAFSVTAIVGRWRERGRPAAQRPGGLADMHVGPATPWQRFLDGFAGPVLAGLVFLALWPLVLALGLWFGRAGNGHGEAGKEFVIPQEREFTVDTGDLRERLSVEDVERRERVSDPLGAVPELPFGHLGPAWQAFREGLEPADELWSFSARRTTTWGGEELRMGYVVVRDGAVGRYLLSARRLLDHP